ncbi:hypothetical protein LX32DRAFT_643267 [Colletotrichum zoysiae]|uniref:Uncharacterized protein n=1 Tax=Colletotrichum zoysiae TaxID=1216348 RepID=A0AAD9H9P4_9PEZI|nr:hypothetical protein LX32DRAFT_643267 [Colletotrichum zoysiae]
MIDPPPSLFTPPPSFSLGQVRFSPDSPRPYRAHATLSEHGNEELGNRPMVALVAYLGRYLHGGGLRAGVPGHGHTYIGTQATSFSSCSTLREFRQAITCLTPRPVRLRKCGNCVRIRHDDGWTTTTTTTPGAIHSMLRARARSQRPKLGDTPATRSWSSTGGCRRLAAAIVSRRFIRT